MRAREFDYLVLGGGTAGPIVARRLAEDPDATICLVEAGPSDEGDHRILDYRRWWSLIGSELDYDVPVEPQERGNSAIRHARGRVLGGCSSHNNVIAFRAFDVDMRAWEALGATGWGVEGTRPAWERLLARVHVETAPPVNACAAAFVAAGQEAGFPLVDMNGGDFAEGVGWLQLNVEGDVRQSSSVAYLHPLSGLPANLTVLTDTRADRLLLDGGGNAIGADTERGRLLARREVIVSCGVFGSPALLMRSGIGPADHLRTFGITVLADLPGVGEHLLDHPEAYVVWEASRPVPTDGTQLWETALLARTDAGLEAPDVMIHFGTQWCPVAGWEVPFAEHAFTMTPNVARARSRGTVRLRSADPADLPRVDPRYYTDPDGYDERVIVAGVKLARRLADQPALRAWVARELAPGAQVRSDEELSEYACRAGNTVHHAAGTCRIGPVVDPELRVRGIGRLRVADASVFPALTAVNPCLTVMMVGERCAELVGAIRPEAPRPAEGGPRVASGAGPS